MIHTDTRSFRAELNTFRKQLDLNFQTVMRSALITLLTMVAMRTPVSIYEDEDPGRAAGSWSISRDNPGRFVIPEGRQSSAEEAIARAGTLSISNPYSVWYLYNNVPYIDELEFGLYPGDGPRTVGGFSTQAPHGMLRLSVIEFHSRLGKLVSDAVR